MVREIASARMRHNLASKHSEAWCCGLGLGLRPRDFFGVLGAARMRFAGRIGLKKVHWQFTFIVVVKAKLRLWQA